MQLLVTRDFGEKAKADRQTSFRECFQILTWLNPAVNVKASQGEDFEPAIAIKSETMGQFHSVSRAVSKTSCTSIGVVIY